MAVVPLVGTSERKRFQFLDPLEDGDTNENWRLLIHSKMVPYIIKDVALVTKEKKRLQTMIIGNIHVETGRPHSGNLWQVSESMTKWMKGKCGFQWGWCKYSLWKRIINVLTLVWHFRILCLAQTRTINNQRILLEIPSISGHAMLRFHRQSMWRHRRLSQTISLVVIERGTQEETSLV